MRCRIVARYARIRRVRTVVAIATLVGAVAASACQQRGDALETLPGRTRPLVAHEWQHPRDFRFGPSRFAAPDPQKALITTESGVRAFVLEDPSDGLVRVTAALPLGRAYERPGELGAAGFIASVLKRARPGEPTLEEMPRRLDVDERVDVTVVTLEALAEDWDRAVSLVIERLRRFNIDESARSAYRTGSITSAERVDVAAADFEPRVELERILATDGVSTASPGMEVRAEGVRSLASRSIRPDLVVMGIGGHVKADAVAGALNDLTLNWLGSGNPPVRSAAAPPQTARSFHALESSTLEGWVAIGRRIGDVPPPERAPLAVLAQILGTRLNIATREMRGLTNRAMITLPDAANGAGLLYLSTGGRSEAVAPLVRFCLDELSRLHDSAEALNDEELARAKGALVLGQWQAALDGPRQASATYALETVRREGLHDFLEWPQAVDAVTAKQVKAAALKYLDPGEMVTVVVGPIEAIRRAKHPRWPVTLDDVRASSPAGH
jgi:predicted Zn-dependent peptidase